MLDVTISVIIPTYNRASTLIKVLEGLAAQTLLAAEGPDALEVILVDDGSNDETPAAVARFAAASKLVLHYHRQANRGPTAARNFGIAASKGSLLVLLGDDTIPAPNLLAEHVLRHRNAGWNPMLAVAGYIAWPAGMHLSPFVRSSGEHGPQFDFHAMRRKGPCSYRYFYASNVSLRRELLAKLKQPFDEDFPAAMLEDVELGYRLSRHGMQLYFHPHAVVYHEHPTTLLQSCRRCKRIGAMSRLLFRKHPELDEVTFRQAILRRFSLLRRAVIGLAAAADFVDRSLRLPMPQTVYRALISAHFAEGVVSSAGQ